MKRCLIASRAGDCILVFKRTSLDQRLLHFDGAVTWDARCRAPFISTASAIDGVRRLLYVVALAIYARLS